MAITFENEKKKLVTRALNTSNGLTESMRNLFILFVFLSIIFLQTTKSIWFSLFLVTSSTRIHMLRTQNVVIWACIARINYPMNFMDTKFSCRFLLSFFFFRLSSIVSHCIVNVQTNCLFKYVFFFAFVAFGTSSIFFNASTACRKS